MARRLALAAACLATLVPVAFRAVASRPEARRPCAPDGRGAPPRHWVGCAADDGPRRDLTGRERLLVGLPVDVNAASPEDLAPIPGLSARLAVAIVADRSRNGRFATVEDLIRVPGIGLVRLGRARPFLSIGP